MSKANKAEVSSSVKTEVATPEVAPQVPVQETPKKIEKPTPGQPKRYVTDTGLTIEDY